MLAGSPISAQESPGLRGSLTADVVFSSAASENIVLLGGQAALYLGSGLSIGGFGYGMPGGEQIVDGAAPEDLLMGYGGLMVRQAFRASDRLDWGLSLLAGAGNAQVRAQPVGNQLGSDNFVVLEPRVSVGLATDRPLTLDLSAGYRFAVGVQDLPGLERSDLQAWTVTLSIRLGGTR